ncbi:HYR domain-containing protein [Bizionia hallyeonensis]|uniref:HYR domain-containing protein n=1 Tax=Bizionia hallyeonensis TaxID=1123757 RepID=A0ABW0C8K9_9FLAO
MMKTTSKSILILCLLLVIFSCKKENTIGNEKVHELTNQSFNDTTLDYDDTPSEISHESKTNQDLLADANFAIEPDKNRTPSKVNNFEVDPKTELISKRDRTTKHYLREDGKTIDAVLSPKSMHYQSKSGSWEDINTNLVPSEKRDYVFANTSNNLRSWFPADPSEYGVIIQTDNSELVMGKNLTMSLTDSIGTLLKANNFKTAIPKANKNTLTYNNVLDGIDNEYVIKADEIKHNIILNSNPISNDNTVFVTFTEDLELPKNYSLEYDQNQTGLVIVDENNQVYLQIPAPQVYEKNNEAVLAPTEDAAFHIEKVDLGINTYRIATKISKQWLENRNYPIIVDPTITLNGNMSGYIRYRYDYDDSGCGSSTTTRTYYSSNNQPARIQVGYYYSRSGGSWCTYRDTYYDHYRSWIKYDTSSIPDVSVINNVEFSANVASLYGNSIPAYLRSSSSEGGNYTTSSNSSQYNSLVAGGNHGTAYYNTTGQQSYTILNGGATTRVQDLLAQDYFQLSFDSNGSNRDNRPYRIFNTAQSLLRVTYLGACENITEAPENPFPFNTATEVCYNGGGAVTVLGWTAVPEATVYDVYFGTSPTPGLLQSNLAANTTTANLNLTANTQYYWRVVPKNDCSTFSNVSTWSFTTAAQVCSDDYCDVTFNNVRPITSVTFGDINNQSSSSTNSPSYENYTAFSTTVVQGNGTSQGTGYNITVKGNTDGAQENRTLYFTAFIDWNQNGDFSDANEYYEIGSVTNSDGTDTEEASTILNIPSGVALGGTTMRIIASRFGYNINPCAPVEGNGNNYYGQTEDYTVNICELPIANCNNDITIQLDESGNASITVSDIDNGSTANCGLQSLTISQTSFDCSDIGQKIVELTITDVFGNSSTCNATVTVLDTEGPEITCLTDIILTTEVGGCLATITDSSYDAIVADNCGIASISNNITNTATLAGAVFDIPSNPTTVIWTVEDTSGNITQCETIFTVETPLPILASVDPVSFLPGDTITLNGNHFTSSGNTININGQTVTPDSEMVTEITFTIPVGVCTDVLFVTNGCGFETNTLPYTVESPVINSINPSILPYEGNVEVLINGTGFSSSGNTVTIGGIAATNIQNESQTSITVTSPAGVCNGTIEITNACGVISNSFGYSVNAPIIGAISISPIVPGSNLIINGANFNPGQNSVSINGIDAPIISDSFASITITVPFLNNVCAADIIVTTCNLVSDTFSSSSNELEPPTISCPNDISAIATSEAGAVVTYTEPQGTDNCGVASTVLTTNLGSGDTFPIGDTTVTYETTDTSGNMVSCSFTVTVVGVAPVINCPATITVNNTIGQCDAIANFSATDVVGIPASVITYSQDPNTIFPIGTTTITATATNAVGTSTCTFDVVVLDSEAPVITCPGNIVQDSDLGSCDAVVTYVVSSSDNCVGETIVQTSGLASGSMFPLGTTTNSFEVTDASGNTATCSFDVTIEDNELPNAVCQDLTVYLDANGQASITAQDINNGSTDNCGIASISISDNSFDCSDVSSGGGTSDPSKSIIISGVFDGPLTGGVPKGIELYVISDISNLSEYGIGSANNGGGSDGEEFTFPNVAVTSGTYIYVASESLQFNAFFGFNPDYTDGSMGINGDDAIELFYNGNVADVFGYINTDGTGQSWDYLNGWAYRNNNSDPNGSTFQSNNWYYSGTNALDGESSNTTATIPFPIGMFTTTQGGGISSGVSVNLTITDNNGNVSTCTASVTVLDAIPPEITCPGNIVQDSDLGSCDAVVNYTVIGSDNCAGEAVVQTAGLASGSAFPLGTTTNTFEVTDASGNTATCSFDVTIEDNELPTVACQDLTVYLDANGQASITAQDIDNGSTDNCEIASISISDNSFDCSDVSIGGTASGVWINELHYDNDGGDSGEFVEVAGTSGFNLTGYSIVLYNGSNGTSYDTINLSGTIDNEGGSGFGAIEFFQSGIQNGAPDGLALVDNLGDVVEFLSYEGSFTATDGPANGLTSTDIEVNEPGSTPVGESLQRTGDGNSSWTGPITASSGDLNAGQNFSSGSGVSVTLTVTDNNGNVSYCNATVTVLDAIAPEITCPGDITQDSDLGSCDAVVNYTVISSDNCAGETLVQTAGLASGSVFPLGTTTNTFEVKDASGNTATCSFDVTIEDNELPTVVCQDLTVYLDANGQASITAQDIDNGSTDNCGIASISISDNSFDCSDVSSGGTTTASTDLFISEYIEGSGNNKCIEIYNGTGADVNLGSYELARYTNGSTSSSEISLSGILADGDVYVVCNSGASSAFTNEADLLTGSMTHNGDDAIALLKNGSAIDIFGRIGQDPGSSWNQGGNSTSDETLVRNSNITDGNTDNDVNFPSLETEWTSLPQNDTSNLGSHTVSGGGGVGVSVTLTVTDTNGNVSSCTAIVTVEDNIAPEITCIADATRDTDLGQCDYTIQGTEFDATFTDNCISGSISNSVNGTSSLSGEVFALGATTVTWTADDGHGQVVTCTTTITVEDNEAPVITCIGNDTRDTDLGQCDYTIQGTEFDASFTDNCIDGSISNSINGTSSLSGEVFVLGATTVTWTADDGHGQIVTCTTTITVEDNEAPVITCIGNDTRDTDFGQCDYTIQGTEFDATFTDNCIDGSISNSINGTSSLSGEVFVLGATTVTWTADDGHGQIVTCTTTITVEDNEAPVITCIGNDTRDTDLGQCDYTIQGTEFDASFTDNCIDGSISNSINGTSSLSGEVFALGATTVTWTADDGHGQIVTCTTTITVEDNEAPVITCIGNDTRDTDFGQCDYTIQGTEFDATFTDNCISGSITNDYNNSASLAGEIFVQGTTTVTWTADDGHGQVVTCTTTITVEDNEAPIVNCLDLQVQLDAFGNGSIELSDINGNSTDNCGIASITLSQLTFDCSDIGGDLDQLIISEYIDGTGNEDCIEIYNGTGNPINLYEEGYTLNVYIDGSSTVTYSVPLLGIIGDREVYVVCNPTSPAAATEADQTGAFAFNGNDAIALVYNGNAVDVFGEIGVNPGTGWSASSVSTYGTTLVRNEDVLQGNVNAFVANLATEWSQYSQNTVSQLGDHNIEIAALANNVILTVTDTSGNVSTCEGNVTVVDQIAPEVFCQDVVVQLDANGVGSTTAQAVDNGSNDACGIASLSLDKTDFTCADVGSNTVTLTVTDNNGNTSTCTATVTVEDNIEPIVVTQDITVQLDASGGVSITPSQIDNGSSDNCGIASQVVVPNSFDCSNIGANTITLTVTDVNGNSFSETAIVTVEDNVDPVASCQNITVVLDGNGVATIIGEDVDSGSSDACGIASYEVTPSVFGCENIGPNTVTLTVTDNYGNTSSCTATVTVEGIVPEVTITQGELPDFCQGAAMVLTANSAEAIEYYWSTGETTESIEVTGNGIYGVLVTSATNCTTYLEYEVTGFDSGSLISAYTILAQDEVFLHGGNLVQTGGVGAMNPNSGNVKLHQASNVVGFAQAVSINLNQGSTVGTPIYAAANPTIPTFVYNTYSNNASPDATVNNNQTVTLNGSVYDVVTVKQGATVIFSQSNVYINELKTFKDANIEFSGCANVILNEKFTLAEGGTINSNGNKVVFYVDEDVQIEKGSDVRASIHAYNHEMLVKGANGNGNNAGEPTYMTGLFIANRVHGNKNIIWNADSLCEPCPIEQPVIGETNSNNNSQGRLSLEVVAWPNPSDTYFNLKLKTANVIDQVEMQVFDMNNKLVHTNKFNPNEIYKFGDKLDSGVYIVKVSQAGVTKAIKLIRY